MTNFCEGVQRVLIFENFLTLSSSWFFRCGRMPSSRIAIKRTSYLAEYPWLPLTPASGGLVIPSHLRALRCA